MDPVRAGYWVSTSSHRLEVSKINTSLFTHLYAGFAKVQYPIPPGYSKDDVIIFPDESGDFENFPQTVKTGTTVKALLSIGGGVTDGDESKAIDSVIANVEEGLRVNFIARSIKLAKQHNYDGLDLCWQYRPTTTKQWQDLVLFLKDWRQAVENEKEKNPDTASEKLLLTATVFDHPPDVPDRVGLFEAITENLDGINVLAIDFYTPANSPTKTGPVHAWLNPTESNRCGSAGIEDWIAKGVPAQKVFLGLPFYGYQWILDNPDDNHLFAPASPAAIRDPILYRNIPDIFPSKDYSTKDDPNYVTTFSYAQKIWIGYDDGCSISTKVEKAICEDKLGGYFAWELGGEDDNWTLSTAAFNACACKSHP